MAVLTPAEAGAIVFEEPDWRELFEAQCLRWPKLPRYLQEDNAFTEVMRQWRRFHWTPVDVDGHEKKMPAGATEAIIALAKLKIMPPRSIWNDIAKTDETGFQSDDHMWISFSQEQWRITAIEDRVLHLSKMTFDDKVEMKQIDLNRAKWNDYIAASVAVLEVLAQSSH